MANTTATPDPKSTNNATPPAPPSASTLAGAKPPAPPPPVKTRIDPKSGE